MIQQQYDENWQDADRVRSFIEQCARWLRSCFRRASTKAIACTALGVSLKLSGLKLRKIVLANGASYWLRPSFIFSSMTGTVDQLAYPLLLAAHGVPPWLLTSVSATATCTGIASSSGWGETVWWEPPSATRHSCPSILWRTSITPTGPARRATSRQPLAAAAFWASR